MPSNITSYTGYEHEPVFHYAIPLYYPEASSKNKGDKECVLKTAREDINSRIVLPFKIVRLYFPGAPSPRAGILLLDHPGTIANQAHKQGNNCIFALASSGSISFFSRESGRLHGLILAEIHEFDNGKVQQTLMHEKLPFKVKLDCGEVDWMVFLTREQIEARLTALHQASLELVSDLSLETVLERIVNLAREQANARYAALGVLNAKGNLVRFIPVGMQPEEVRMLEHPPIGEGLIGAIQRERKTIRVPNISADARKVGFPKNHPDMTSFLGVPILSGSRLLGQIYLTDKIGYTEFTQDDELVIETLAAYAAVAITNAQMYADLLERDDILTLRNNDLALLNDLAASLAGSLELDEILDHTLTKVMAYLEVEAGEIFLSEEDGQELRLALHRGEAARAFWTRDRFAPGEGFIGIVAESGKPLVSVSPQTDMRFLRKAVVDAGFRCIACIPLNARGSIMGVMGIATRQERNLDQRELNLLMAIGTWAGIAIENARLKRQAARLAVLEERERIGMDLHDGIIQSIYAVGLALDYARLAIEDDPQLTREKISMAVDGLNSTIRDIRSYILDLRPRQFRGEDLMEGLQRLADEFRANTRIDTNLIGPDDGALTMPTTHATALFHICQEALANVAKHAQATQAKINLWTAPERVLLEISDDGAGFDLRKMSVTLGHGLSNMHTRARKVGGDVEITSETGKGTTVLAWVPVSKDDDVLKSC
jgi:two-component system, NarL family, sensor histidine kinase DevS